jgi:uncharacterized membrane protein YgcG
MTSLQIVLIALLSALVIAGAVKLYCESAARSAAKRAQIAREWDRVQAATRERGERAALQAAATFQATPRPPRPTPRPSASAGYRASSSSTSRRDTDTDYGAAVVATIIDTSSLSSWGSSGSDSYSGGGSCSTDSSSYSDSGSSGGGDSGGGGGCD